MPDESIVTRRRDKAIVEALLDIGEGLSPWEIRFVEHQVD